MVSDTVIWRSHLAVLFSVDNKDQCKYLNPPGREGTASRFFHLVSISCQTHSLYYKDKQLL